MNEIREIIERLNGLGNMSDEERAEAADTMERLLAVAAAAEEYKHAYENCEGGIPIAQEAALQETLANLLAQTKRDKIQSS